MPPGPDVAVACAPDEPCPEPEPAPVEKYCAPEDYYWGAYGSGYDDAVAEASGNENDALTGAERSSAPNPGSDGSDGSGGSAKGDPSTCATGLGTRPAAPALLLFLGLVLGRVRRRR